MARIRSIHPGFFTDEDLVSVSMAARLLFLGLGVEADDKGIFEWKALTIKMKIFPAENIDVAEILAELVSVNAIKQYEIDGRKYGAIRNFRKHQRPKTPNDIHPITPEIRNYVGLSDDASEGVRNDFGNVSEIAPQMEDGGGNKEEIGSRVSNETLSPSASASDFEKFKAVYPDGRGAAAAEKAWNEAVNQGADPNAILTGVANSVAFWNAEGVKGRFIPEAKNYLANRTWLTHAAVTETPKAVPDVSITWDGPDEVLQAVSAEAGETFARSYLLLSARYDASRDAILTRTEIAADKLRRLNRLRDLGCVIEKDAA